ncbi:ABC transporter permease [Verticiella sediminum]|uniref:ABC transporter permease n=1 Tax=Verticiella sediminum TaxID=1247510 RepID=A0A556AQA7_9BURK|nr:ABC transporter permease [Verticiella sediminum]TSH95073.1 ABC transporter permease [Verticiella sediminum]
MWNFLLQRALLALAVALATSAVTFALLNLSIDPAAALVGDTDDPLVVEQVRKQLGLDRPATVRYAEWLQRLAAGDLGESYVLRQPVLEVFAQHAPVTLKLAFLSLLVTVLVAVPLGIAAAARPDSAWDRLSLTLAAALQASPNFWLGLVFILFFAVHLGWLPVSGDQTWANFVLPALILGTASVPNVMRLTRSGLIDVLQADFIRTARAKGYTGWALLRRHALRNALLPVVGVLAVTLGNSLGGSMVTEVVFAMNGLGRLALNSVLTGDIPTLQMLVLLMALVFVGVTFMADLLNAWLDPRIRVN